MWKRPASTERVSVPRSWRTLVSTRIEPKPGLLVAAGASPCSHSSFHITLTPPSSQRQPMVRLRASGLLNAPYLIEFVAHSCRIKAIGDRHSRSSVSAGPSIRIRPWSS